MKKLIALFLIFALLLTAFAACGAKEETAEAAPAEEVKEEAGAETEAVEETAEEPEEEEAEEEEEESGELLDGVKVTVYQIDDRCTVIVRFNMDLFGYTDVPNYDIVDANGNKVTTLISANSAFWDLGGEVTNVFKLVFSEPLAVGTYTITVNNIVDAITEPYHNFVPCEAELIITEDIPESAE